jgi:phosphatidylserine/phosphatidylglycerophosphate/cardiolipin synthase-like enzyme
VQADRLERALALLDPVRIDDNYGTLSAIVRGARAMSRHSDGGEAVELVWTGPNPLTSALYRTEQTLLDLIESAHRTLLIVTFAAYKVTAVREALANAAGRGVRVTVVAEQAEEDGGKLWQTLLCRFVGTHHAGVDDEILCVAERRKTNRPAGSIR